MKKSLMRLAGLSVVAAVAFAVSRSQASIESLVGKPAPAISLKTADGKDVSLASLKGKVVLVDFWATWCGPCKASLPNINKIANDKDLAAKGLVVWAVNLDETPDKVNAFTKQNNYSLTVPIDVGGAVAETYKIQGIPSTMVIGTDGTIKYAVEGFGGEDTEKAINDAITKALAAK
jgi:peroxiredoxin